MPTKFQYFKLNFSFLQHHLIHKTTHLLTPFFPLLDISVLDISGLIQARSFRCSVFLNQSSQKAFGQFSPISSQSFRVSIQPRPGKKSVRCTNSLKIPKKFYLNLFYIEYSSFTWIVFNAIFLAIIIPSGYTK